MRSALDHRRRRLHRQHARRPAERRRRRGRHLRQLRTGRREFVAGARARDGVELVEGDVLDGDRLAAALEGCDTVFHLAGERRRAPRPRAARRATSSRTRSPPPIVLEAMRAAGVTRIAFSSTGSVYGEPEVFPTPEDVPVPGADVALRRLEARGRGADPGLRARVRLHGGRLPLRLDPRRALHARPRLRLLPRAARATRRGCACSATAARRSRTSTSATASRR